MVLGLADGLTLFLPRILQLPPMVLNTLSLELKRAQRQDGFTSNVMCISLPRVLSIVCRILCLQERISKSPADLHVPILYTAKKTDDSWNKENCPNRDDVQTSRELLMESVQEPVFMISMTDFYRNLLSTQEGSSGLGSSTWIGTPTLDPEFAHTSGESPGLGKREKPLPCTPPSTPVICSPPGLTDMTVKRRCCSMTTDTIHPTNASCCGYAIDTQYSYQSREPQFVPGISTLSSPPMTPLIGSPLHSDEDSLQSENT